MKDYEKYGIPDNAWLDYNEPPDFAIIYEDNGIDDPFNTPFEFSLVPGDIRLWGCINYWTALEAALLIAGVSPDDTELYAVSQQSVPDEGYGNKISSWKYAPIFHFAKHLLFLFERSDLAPKASPMAWVKYFLDEIQGKAFGKGYEPNRINFAEEWHEYLSVKVSETDQKKNIEFSTWNNPSRREQQYEVILAVITALNYDPKLIPDGGKAKIKIICLTRPRLFTDASFDHAWKDGVSVGHFKLANHEKFSPSK